MNKTPFDLVTYSLEMGEQVLARRSETNRKQLGQFFTSAPIARFMAWQLGRIRPGDRILDPAIGSGVLVCALIERLITDGQPLEIWLDGYEIAWETEVWLAEIPEQLIHFNGDRFSGPHKQG